MDKTHDDWDIKQRQDALDFRQTINELIDLCEKDADELNDFGPFMCKEIDVSIARSSHSLHWITVRMKWWTLMSLFDANVFAKNKDGIIFVP